MPGLLSCPAKDIAASSESWESTLSFITGLGAFVEVLQRDRGQNRCRETCFCVLNENRAHKLKATRFLLQLKISEEKEFHFKNFRHLG